MTGDRALAEDLAQETFVKAFRNLPAFDGNRRLSSWLFRIAHNTAIDKLRQSRPALVSLDSPESGKSMDLAANPSADPIERQALGRALEAAQSRLRPEYRAAIALRYELGLQFDEIGQTLGVPEVTARTFVHRARKELMRHLAEAGWAPNR
jgi:RNA polymerase sigma-70 factor (ECF subfamily)